MNDIKDLYKRVHELGVFKTGDFTLSSGKKSNFYLDGRILSLDPEGAEKIGKIFLSKIDFTFDKIGGPATAAIPLISSIILTAKFSYNKKLPGFYVRPSAKEHGLTNKIEGSLIKGDNVVIVDDTVTTGSSIINTIKEIHKVGANIKYSLSVFDRNEGGVEKIKQAGIEHYSIFKYNDEKKDLVF